MSITSSHDQEPPQGFAQLLVHYPGLAAWLSYILQSQEEPRAEELLPHFLTECSHQGVPGSAYPFTTRGWGLEDLRAYLQAARTEIDAFAASPIPRGEAPAGESATRDVKEIDLTDLPTPQMAALAPPTEEEHDVTAVSEISTENIPVIDLPATSSSSSDRNEAGWENSDAVDMVEGNLSEVATSPMPATVLANVEITPATPVSPPETIALEGSPPAAVAREIAGIQAAPLEISLPETTRGASKEGKQAQLVASPGIRAPFRFGRKRNGRPRTRRQRILSWALLLLILAAVLVPAAFLVNFGISAYTTYRSLSDQAHGAVNQLLDAKKVFSGDKSYLNGIFDPIKLRQAQRDFAASGRAFRKLQNQLKQSPTINTITNYLPQYRTTLSSALAASTMGADVSQIGQIAIANAIPLAPSLNGPLLASSGKPLVTQQMLNTIGATLNQVAPLLNDIAGQSHNIVLDSLPISATEKAQLGQLLQLLPQALSDLSIGRSLLGDAGWLLGVDHPRTFLVQTMDRAELRGAGGFTGQYGELKISGGRVAPFSLTDIGPLEESSGSANLGKSAPEQYRSWWPFANWGLRDSNVSADFPTTAQVAIDLYQKETNHQVDGVISFTPVVIEHILTVIGSLQVPGYNTLVTAQNLESLLHYYQLDNAGIFKQYQVQQSGGAGSSTSLRKQFTSQLSSLLIARVRSAPPNELLTIAQQVFSDLKSKDLQVYFTNPASERILMQYGYAGQLDRSSTHDGLYIVQENLSASKASQYVQTTMHDTVALDSKGGATHQLQIHLVYNQAGPVYGYDTYYDYLRVYVPPGSHLISGDGFSSGTPLCGGRYGDCPLTNVYPGGELICPAGQYQPGAMPPTLTDPSGADWQPLQTLGGPTNTLSDEPGRAMYGGWVVVPKNCTMDVTLSWYVPPVAQHGYSLLVQRQAGTFPELDLSILPDAANCAQLATTGVHFDGVLTRDTSFTPLVYNPAKQGAQSCYPRSGV